MERQIKKVVFGAILVLAGCDGSSPTSIQDAVLDEAASTALAESVLTATEAKGQPLPSLENLLRRAFRAIRAQGGHEEAQKAFRKARWHARQARDAQAAGDATLAQRHSRQGYALTLDGLLLVLGPEVVHEGLAGVGQALARLEERFEGKTLPDWIQKRLDRAVHHAAQAQEALRQGILRAALAHTLEAANLLRSLSPRYQAHKAIDWATRALHAAYEAVRADPTESEREALQKARRLLATAKDAFKEKSFMKARRFALESARLSLGVLEDRSGG